MTSGEIVTLLKPRPLYRNAGAMTLGITDETADGMSLEKIDSIIDALRHERYHWKPARRVWIPKKNGKKRPLGVTTWSDKLVAEVVRLILDAYFDVQMSEHSHGFREGRGCGSALREIYYTWRGTTWLLEGDIADCFGTLSLSSRFMDQASSHLLGQTGTHCTG